VENRSGQTCVAGTPGVFVLSADAFKHERFCQKPKSKERKSRALYCIMFQVHRMQPAYMN